MVLAWHVGTDQETYSDLPMLSGAPTQTETSSSYPCELNQCQAHSGLRHFSACWSIVQLHRRLPHKVPVGEANQQPRSRYSDPTFSECLQRVWLPYRDSERTSDFQELCLKFNIIHKPGTPHSQWKNGRCENAIGRLNRLLEKSKEEETSMEDILLNIRDVPLDANTPSPYELMFHRLSLIHI